MPPEGEIIMESPAMPQVPADDVPLEELPQPPVDEDATETPDQVLPGPDDEVRSQPARPMLSEILGGSAAPVVRHPAGEPPSGGSTSAPVKQARREAVEKPAQAADPNVDLVEFQSADVPQEPRNFNPLRSAKPAPARPSSGWEASVDSQAAEPAPQPIDIGWRKADDS